MPSAKRLGWAGIPAPLLICLPCPVAPLLALGGGVLLAAVRGGLAAGLIVRERPCAAAHGTLLLPAGMATHPPTEVSR